MATETDPLDVETEWESKDSTTPKAEPREATARPMGSDRVADEVKDVTDKASRGGKAAAAKDATKNAVSKGTDTAKAAAKTAASKGKDWGGRLGKFAMKQVSAKKFVTRVVPALGAVMLADDVFQLVAGQDPILHNPPASGRTKYLPVAGNGHIDNPHGDTANSVDSMDSHIDGVNEASFKFDPNSVYSYCQAGCDQGCPEVTASVFEFDVDAAVHPIEVWADIIGEIYSTLSGFEGEMWADRLLTKYGTDGSAELPALLERTDAVTDALKKAIRSSQEMGSKAYDALRASITSARDEMQARVDDENSLYGWIGDALTNSRGDNALDHLKEKTNAVTEAEKLNDDSVAALNAALDAWTTTPANDADETTAPDDGIDTSTDPLDDDNKKSNEDKTSEDKTSEEDFWDKLKEKLGTENLTDGGTTPFSGTTTPETTPDTTPVTDPSTDDPFGDTGTPTGDTGSSPFSDMGGGSTPSSGGGSPFGDMGSSPLSDSGSSPFGADSMSPLSDEAKDPFEEEKPEDEKPEDEKPEDEKDPDDEHGEEDPEGKDGEDKPGTGEGEPLPGDDGDVSPDEADAPVTDAPIPDDQSNIAADPNSEAARTVDVGDGRQVVFPDAKTAEMVRNLMAAEPGNPTSIYMAADKAGFDLPPMGQDIGQMVPPASIQVGDLVMGESGNGIYIGNDEVLMENQEVKPYSEVATYGADHQGLFRLEQPDMAGTEGTGSQPVGDGGTINASAPSDGSAAPVGAPSDGGTPGVPSEGSTASTGNAEQDSVGGGTSENTTGMDPNSAFGM